MTLSRRRAAQLLLAGFGATAAGCASVQAPPPAPSYRVVDLMPAYWDFWARAQAVDERDRPALFRQMVVSRAPLAYAPAVIGLDADKPYDEELARRYHRVQAMVADRTDLMRRLSGRIARDLRDYEATFRRTFPDLAYGGDIYFMHSMGGFDGGTRLIGGHMALLFGVDMIAYVYGEEADPQPFFHHELFHVYHAQFFPPILRGGEHLVEMLWGEGLATYVAQALNPRASGVAIFGLPRSTPARVRADLPAIATALRERLDSHSRDDFARYFLGSDEHAAVPARSGYYVGFLVAQRLAQRRSLVELAHAPLSALRPDIEAVLAAMGSP